MEEQKQQLSIQSRTQSSVTHKSLSPPHELSELCSPASLLILRDLLFLIQMGHVILQPVPGLPSGLFPLGL